MENARKLLWFGLALVAAGIGGYFIPMGEPMYDDNATYTMRRFENGKYVENPVSGRNLNQQTEAQPENKLIGMIMAGTGVVALGGYFWASRRK